MYNTVKGGYANRKRRQSCSGVHFPTAKQLANNCGLIEWSWQNGIQLILDLAPL